MKRGVLAALVAAAFLALPGPAPAQEHMPDMTMFTIFADHVKPAMATEYEAGLTKLVDAFTAAGIQDMRWVTISGPELGYAFAVPGMGPTDFNDMYAEWQAAVDKVGSEKFMGIMSATNALVERQEMYYLALRSDLSYMPETVDFDPAKPMRHYTILLALPGKEDALEEVARKFKALYAKHDIDRGWRFYQYMTGSDLPAYMVVESAASEHDHFMAEARISEIMGDEAQALYAEATAVMRGMREMTGWMRPDLSYPRMEMATSGE